MVPLLTSLILTAWVMAIAIISVQNFAPVSFEFLLFKSVEIPFGIVLAFSVGLGVVGMALVQLLWGLSNSMQGASAAPRDGGGNAQSDDSWSEDW
uniref:LapA family protein n=1 Tax=Trichocoleus desertorum TaxID=1481672 RepID=UPI0025B3FDFA|nr:LapA family protein [Trichocoleus desertorum]